MGDFSVICPKNWPLQKLIWVNHNICIRLVIDNSDQSTITKIAREIDSLLNTFIVSDLTKHIPKIDKLEISAKQIHPDEKIELKIEYSGVEPENAMIEFDSPDNSLKYVTQDKTTAIFSGKSPGKGLVNIYVIDKTTLLSAFKVVEIDIIEPEEKKID